MTRLRNLVIGGLAALAMASVTSAAFAEEPTSFQNRLFGASIGIPLGAAAPPGLYTGLETAYLGNINQWSGSGGSVTGNWAAFALGKFGTTQFAVPTIAQAVPLLWSTGWNFLGAHYSMAVVQAFYNTDFCIGPPPCNIAGAAATTIANTTWSPIMLSWNLGGGLFASIGFNFMGPDGSHYVGTANPDYWTFEPAFAVAYLSRNWAIAANFFYDINTANRGGPCCSLGNFGETTTTFTGGNEFIGDLSALYKFGKWSIGPVAAFEVQTTGDNVSGAATCATYAVAGVSLCGNQSNFEVGALVGYDFGPVDLQVWFTDVVEAQNTAAGVGGIYLWSRLSFRLWAPEAKPLVAKN